MENNTVTDNGSCAECTSAKGGLAILGQSVVETVSGNQFDRNSLGVQVASGSVAEIIQNTSFNGNETTGVLVRVDSQVSLSSVEVSNNGGDGVASADAGTTVSLENSTVTNNGGWGLNAQTDSVITCSGTNTLTGNAEGSARGDTQGCN